MKILHQLDKPGFKPSKADRVLIKYIRENAEFFCTSPIATIAAGCGVSEATITRFVRKMGFNSLQLFKLTLTEELTNSRKLSIISGDISCDEPISETAGKLLNNNIAMLELTVSSIDEEAIMRVVKKVRDAERVYIIGLGNSGFVADDSAYKFMRIGIDARGVDNSHLIMMHMAIIHQRDLVIAITHSGESFEIIKAAQLAKKEGIDFVVITSNRNTVLKEYATACIFYESGESILETGSITTKLTQIFIVDLIYTQIVKQTMELSAGFKTRTAEAINVLRLPDSQD